MSKSAISVLLFVLLLPVSVFAQNVQTSGECSPAVVDNAGTISVNCYIDDVPLESVVRQGLAQELLEALESGLSAETILQGFVLGNPRSLSGVSFFRNADPKQLAALLNALADHVNLNNRIYFREDSFTTLFQLAASSTNGQSTVEMARLGMAVHAPQHIDGGAQDRFLLPELFPVLDLVRNGSVSVQDADALTALYALSFPVPGFEAGRENTDGMRAERDFIEALDLRRKLVSRVPDMQARAPYDFGNAAAICELASRSDNFDWCARLRSVSTVYRKDSMNDGMHYPLSIALLGLMNIRDDNAVFLAHHTRAWGGIGMFFVPRVGTKYRLGMWNSGSGGVQCWSETLNGYDKSCWRYYLYEEDIFEPGRLAGPDGFPVYIAGEEKVDF
ncbi:hypothetical protein [Pseudoruegeria sp. HB172150]|uniref:hypothetical protein n=1 Tax=Pseudoruegeria sp. HB172150 TaxID=2721164 RepID=UPI0015571262|nr:hypothetical protein [Pseudoruegeria sp. HB172150]